MGQPGAAESMGGLEAKSSSWNSSSSPKMIGEHSVPIFVSCEVMGASWSALKPQPDSGSGELLGGKVESLGLNQVMRSNSDDLLPFVSRLHAEEEDLTGNEELLSLGR